MVLRQRFITALCAGARRGIWENLFRELARNGRSTATQMIDSTHVKAHRSAAGGKGGRRSRLLAARAEGATGRFAHAGMLLPNPIDQNPWAHWRSPMDMMRQGWSTSLFHAAQQWSTRSS